ncbi:MAG: isoprenyl transferase [Alphaproteobacteria bacterium]|nr:isoprenyl transferase [Alphaproteobacteria bacterium]
MGALPSKIENAEAPTHVAIIMDGNGRWARARGLPRTAGHRRGAESVRRAVETARTIGISYLTLYGFSSENWKRPPNEVDDLMGLLRLYLRSEIKDLSRNSVRVRVIGDRGKLPTDIVDLIEDAEQTTVGNSALTLIVALSYGARAEITAAARCVARKVKSGELEPNDVDEHVFERFLSTDGIPDPDLLIRTSGEQRLSNFLLWQCAYAELVFVDTLWPDFTRDDFEDAIDEFRRRERRYGTAAT